jgi:hypothetical protein
VTRVDLQFDLVLEQQRVAQAHRVLTRGTE